MTKRLAIFAGYDGKGQIHDYVVYYLKELKKVADIVFVSDNHFTAESLAPIQDLIIHSICLPHGEYDFGSYKRGYCWAKETGLLDEYDSLIFCNDSVFGPFRPLEPIFEQFEQKQEVDFWGMFCHHGPRTPQHIQSYFIIFTKQVFNHDVFVKFICSVSKEENKSEIVSKYEAGLSRLLLKNGFKADALFTSRKNIPNNRNAVKIIKAGFPFFKRALFDPDSSIFCGIINYSKALNQANSQYAHSLIQSYIHNYFGSINIDSLFIKSYYRIKVWLRLAKRFCFQRKINKHGNLTVKVCKLQVYKSRKKFKPTPASEDILVSVVMPVYNGSEYLSQTIESILHQSYSNFEFIIIDDCSTDNSYEILQAYAARDPRIKLFRTPENFGNPGGTSAFGIRQVDNDAKYIIMTDQDDISVKDRIRLQIRTMEDNPDVDFCGSQMKMFGTKFRTTRPRQKDPDIKAHLLTSAVISNPTLIIRKRFLDDNHINYRNQISHDYRLLAEAALEHKAVFHNMQTILVHYRCHEKQTSVQHKDTIIATSDAVRAYQLQKLGITRQADIDFFNSWKAKEVETTEGNLNQLKKLFEIIISSNLSRQLYPHLELTQRLSYLYKKELLKSRNLSNIIQAMAFTFTKACYFEALKNS